MKEKLCRKCGECWPATPEFFFAKLDSLGYRRLSSPCKACIMEKRRETNRTKVCCVEGCNNPRHPKGRYSRCIDCFREQQREWSERRKVAAEESG